MKLTSPAGALLVLQALACVGSGRSFSIGTSSRSTPSAAATCTRTTATTATTAMTMAATDDETGDVPNDTEAERLRRKAEELREQIRAMEDSLGDSRPRNYEAPPTVVEEEPELEEMSLKKKRVLVVGANGRLGSMVCRNLLRNNPQTEVVACVHYVGEDSPTQRGYGRLSYEVGAEDGVGNIGAAWSGDDRVATFEYADYMKDYNLQNLRLVECELLDPVQCNTICEGVDSVIWCATDFNGNQPRAVSGLNIAFLFRAVADPTKGRVEIEGLRNMMGALKLAQQESSSPSVFGGTSRAAGKQPTNFVLVSTAPYAFKDFETPFGTFNGLKREGEDIVKKEFPSLSHTILQMSRYEDNFVQEDLPVEYSFPEDGTDPIAAADGDDLTESEKKAYQEATRRAINRRDAAKAAVDALTSEELQGKTAQLHTAIK